MGLNVTLVRNVCGMFKFGRRCLRVITCKFGLFHMARRKQRTNVTLVRCHDLAFCVNKLCFTKNQELVAGLAFCQNRCKISGCNHVVRASGKSSAMASTSDCYNIGLACCECCGHGENVNAIPVPIIPGTRTPPTINTPHTFTSSSPKELSAFRIMCNV